ncbi:hypothetical protein CRUP_037023 [Coryphaenoides rupestris]|nr:hypothetical protein CRUP_037023 [Coryphaenoides rupestris]
MTYRCLLFPAWFPTREPRGAHGDSAGGQLAGASIMQRMAPHCSFARWLLCNGSLFRFKHPSEGELCALAGKLIPKPSKRDRRQNGESKPLTVPKDIDLHLEKAPVNALDALVLRFFLEYQWLVDFAVYAAGVFLFTECYASVVDVSKEVNIGAIWRTLHTLMSHYFRSDEGGERSVCLAFGFLSLLVAMLVLVVREDYLEFGLDSGFASVFDNLEVFARQQGYAEWSIPVTKLSVKLGLAAVCAFIGALLAFPGLRLAQTHLDAVQMNSDRPLIQKPVPNILNTSYTGFFCHISFLSPVIIVLLWIKPIARDFLANAPMGKTSVTLRSTSVRLWVIVTLCMLKLALTRYHLQAYLNLAQKWVEQMKKEAGRIATIDIQRKVTRVSCYLTVVTLQYLIPVLIILFSTLAFKALGEFSWGLHPDEAVPGVTPALILPTAAPVLPGGGDDDEEGAEDMEEDIQATVARLTEAFATLRTVLTPLFFRGFFAFLTWWVAACQLISSLFGVYFHQYLMAN